ncbi:MAG: hypothetical protein ABIM58_00440 [candidate division WOR-3 bacterium]
MELKVRGSLFLVTRIFLIEKLGEKNYKEKLKKFSQEISKFLEGEIIETLFYPYELLKLLHKEIFDKIFKGDIKKFREIGKYSIKREFEIGSFRELIKKVDIKNYIYQVGSMVYNYFYSFGKFEIKSADLENKKIVIHITDMPDIDFFFEERIRGALEAAGEIKGFKGLKVDITKRVSKGDNLLEYVITYK